MAFGNHFRTAQLRHTGKCNPSYASMAPVVRNLWSAYTVAVKEIYQKPATMFIINFIVYTILDYLIQLFLDLGFGIELPKYHSYLAFMNGEAYLGDGAVFALLGCAFFYYFAPRWNSLFMKLKKWMRILICILLTTVFVLDLLSGIIQY